MKKRFRTEFLFILVQVIDLACCSCPNGWMRHDLTCYHFSHDTESMFVARNTNDKQWCEKNLVEETVYPHYHGLSDFEFREHSSARRTQLSCQMLGGKLLEIETAAENAYIAGYIKDKYSHYLISLNDIQEEGVWVWTESASPASYLNWRPGEPNSGGNDENCVVMDQNNGQWLDIPCHNYFHYICEKKDADAEIIGK